MTSAARNVIVALVCFALNLKLVCPFSISRPALVVTCNRYSRSHRSKAAPVTLRAESAPANDGDEEASDFKSIPGSEGQRIPVESPPVSPKKQLDPLVASLTRVDETTPDAPTVKAPLLGEIPLDGSIVVLIPAALIAVVGFIMSINVAVNSKDAIVQSMSQVEIPKMEYTAPVIEEGKCRGICSSQEQDLDNLRGFLDSLGGKKAGSAATVVDAAKMEQESVGSSVDITMED